MRKNISQSRFWKQMLVFYFDGRFEEGKPVLSLVTQSLRGVASVTVQRESCSWSLCAAQVQWSAACKRQQACILPGNFSFPPLNEDSAAPPNCFGRSRATATAFQCPCLEGLAAEIGRSHPNMESIGKRDAACVGAAAAMSSMNPLSVALAIPGRWKASQPDIRLEDPRIPWLFFFFDLLFISFKFSISISVSLNLKLSRVPFHFSKSTHRQSVVMHLHAPFVLSFAGLAIAAGCNEDNCLRALIGTRRGPEWPKTASTDCVKYLQATVTPSPVTILTTTTVTPAPTAPLARRAEGPIPDYASACSGAVRYSSACSCLGVLPTTFTAPTPVSA